MSLYKFLLSVICLFFLSKTLLSQSIKYPYPVKYININLDSQNCKMAYMDIASPTPNGKSIILFHGKNFNGYYWKEVISFLSKSGYRVIVPDQIGWGRSTKPNLKYTFEMLAENNRKLLDSLQIEKIIVLGHSMGGMLAVRFALMYPENTTKLILEDPLGLEDYKKFVPYKTMESIYKKELNATYASYKKYQKNYYPVWKPEYEQYVKAQAEPLKFKDFNSVAWVNALTYLMIYEQPVLYEFDKLTMPVLIMVGKLDRTILGKEMLSKDKQRLHGNFPLLVMKAKESIKNCKLNIIPGIGHIPHLQNIILFKTKVLDFLEE